MNLSPTEAHDADAASSAVSVAALIPLHLLFRDCVELGAVTFDDQTPISIGDEDVGSERPNSRLRFYGGVFDPCVVKPLQDGGDKRLLDWTFGPYAGIVKNRMRQFPLGSARAVKGFTFAPRLADTALAWSSVTKRALDF